MNIKTSRFNAFLLTSPHLLCLYLYSLRHRHAPDHTRVLSSSRLVSLDSRYKLCLWAISPLPRCATPIVILCWAVCSAYFIHETMRGSCPSPRLLPHSGDSSSSSSPATATCLLFVFHLKHHLLRHDDPGVRPGHTLRNPAPLLPFDLSWLPLLSDFPHVSSSSSPPQQLCSHL